MMGGIKMFPFASSFTSIILFSCLTTPTVFSLTTPNYLNTYNVQHLRFRSNQSPLDPFQWKHRTGGSKDASSSIQRPRRCQRLDLTPFPIDSASLLTAVEFFDGSSIVDPVVVSNAFWAGLKGKIVSVIIGQLIAAAVFAALASYVLKQLPKITEFLLTKLSKDGDRISFAKEVNSVSGYSASPTTSSDSRLTTAPPDLVKLVLCLLIDTIGTSSEFIPVFGELTDVVWAPIGATALRSLFGNSNVIFILEFAEEILPFTDILPLATLCWTVETFYGSSDLARILQIGKRQQRDSGLFRDDIVDVESEAVDDRIKTLNELKGAEDDSGKRNKF